MNKVSQRARKSVDTPWINAIPVEWSLKPIKTVLNQVSRPVGESASETTLLSLTQKGVIPRDLESGKGKFPSDFSTYQRVFPQELVFCLFDIDETPRAVGLCSAEGMVTGAYSVFQVKKDNDPKFLSHLFHWIDNEKGLRPYYTGLRKVVRPQTFGSIKIPIPELSEQIAIANFLDQETAKIDSLIAEQERLIELLQEKRQAVISHVVTKGLNPYAPTKDSGVEWIGEVPEHWSVLRASRVSRVFVPQRDKPDLNEEGDGYPWITPEALSEDGLITGDLYVSRESANKTQSRTLKEGSVIATCVGQYGLAAVLPIESIVNQQIQGFIPAERIAADFMCLVIQVSSKYFESIATSTTIQYVNKSGFESLPIALPPREEQEEIVDYIKAEKDYICLLIDQALRCVELLNERRSSLISAAVTGQIDVRGLVAEEEAA